MATVTIPQIENAFKQAAVAAINRAIVTARAAATRKVREVYAIKSSDLKKYVSIKRASYSKHEAIVDIRGRKIPIIHFGAKQTKRGVSVRIKKAEGRKVIPGAFIKKGQVWRRVGKARMPIKPLFTVAPAKMFELHAIKIFQEIAQQEFAKNFSREVDFRLGKII